MFLRTPIVHTKSYPAAPDPSRGPEGTGHSSRATWRVQHGRGYHRTRFHQKQRCQVKVITGPFTVLVKRRCDPEGPVEVIDGLFCLALGAINFTEEAVTLTDQKLIAFVGEGVECSGYSLFRGVELLLAPQQPCRYVAKNVLVLTCC